MRSGQVKQFRTVDARPDNLSMIKPGELIDVIEMTPLTLTDRRIFNILIENAWDSIDRPVTHSIPKTGDRPAKQRLKKDVMFALSSKYSLALYELCEKRVNMGRRWSEDFSVDRLRQLLGVDPDKLIAFKSLNQRAIQPAVAEVNFLSDFGCSVEPVHSGRKVVKVRVSWWKKNIDEIKAAYRELQAAKVGRRARLKDAVERIIPDEGELPSPGPKPNR